MKDIVYIVTLKDEYRKYLELTTVDKIFCGKYIKSEYKKVYFELNNSKAIVIIPEEWIEFMAPSKRCNKNKHFLFKEEDLGPVYYRIYHQGDLICYSKVSADKLKEIWNKEKDKETI